MIYIVTDTENLSYGGDDYTFEGWFQVNLNVNFNHNKRRSFWLGTTDDIQIDLMVEVNLNRIL